MISFQLFGYDGSNVPRGFKPVNFSTKIMRKRENAPIRNDSNKIVFEKSDFL